MQLCCYPSCLMCIVELIIVEEIFYEFKERQKTS